MTATVTPFWSRWWHRIRGKTREAGQAAQRRQNAAQTALRAAGLLRGGMPVSRLWKVLGDETGDVSELSEIAKQIAVGTSPAEAIAAVNDPAWRVLAAVWRVAELSGAPLAPTLTRLAETLRALEQVAARRTVLLAGPRSTIRLVIALPPMALLLGALLGFDPTSVLTSPAGLTVALMGSLLLALGAKWAAALVARVAAADRAAGLAHELCAVSINGGGAVGDALRRVADCVDTVRAEWVLLSDLTTDGPVRSVCETASALGAPLAPALLAAAETARAHSLAAFESEAERLAVRVLVPLGVCVLPAFVLLGVMPVLMAMLGGVSF